MRGAKVSIIIWDETPAEHLAYFDCVIVRSIWDYQRKLPKFINWLSQIEKLGIKTLNAPELIKWNLSKRYLKELKDIHQIRTVPTVWIEKNDNKVEKSLKQISWKKIVIKPETSAAADLTYFHHFPHPVQETSADSLSLLIKDVHQIQHRCAVMIQPYCESIVTEGETSLIYFSDGRLPRFSHAVNKRPKSGDFRIQHEHGGSYQNVVPEKEVSVFGKNVVSKIKPGWLFARVDVVKYNNELCLGELELIEPQLYFRWAPKAAELFAESVLSRLQEFLN